MASRPYLFAAVAILAWSTLASIASQLRGLDPFLATGIGLCIGGALSLQAWRSWLVRPGTFTVGCLGIFGYHALYFDAFAHAPAMTVNVLNYLWPLFIVVLAPVILGGRLPVRQLCGAVLGLGGTIVLIGHSAGAGAGDSHLPGCLLAASAALVWALYSLLCRALPPFPSSAVGGFCLVSGLAALGCAGLRGHGVVAALAAVSLHSWLLLVLAGIGPLGLAFYCWDAALKGGDPRRIAVLAYVTPILSTLILALTTRTTPDLATGAALSLTVLGILIAASHRTPVSTATTSGPAAPGPSG